MNVSLISKYDYIPFKEYENISVEKKKEPNIEIQLFRNEIKKYSPVSTKDSFRVEKKNIYENIRYLAKNKIFEKEEKGNKPSIGYYRKKLIGTINELKKKPEENLVDILV